MRVAVVVIAMLVSAVRPTTQHVADRSDHPAQLDVARPAFVAVDALPEMPALLASLAFAPPLRTSAPVAAFAADHVVVDTVVTSQLARGPPV